MESNNKYEEHINDFVAFMSAKGYRSRFQICENEFSERKKGFGYLKNCLEGQVGVMIKNNSLEHAFFLSTEMYSTNIKERIECRLTINYDPTDGFVIREVRIKPETHPDKKHLHLRHNNELPGYHAVDGMFIKKKIWDDHMRGRFGFRK